MDLSGSPTWKAANDEGSITIGVYHDQPGIGSLTTGAEQPQGFDVEIATLVAGQLGFVPDDIDWVETVTANRETFLQQGNVDLLSGAVDAATTDDAILRGYAAQTPEELTVIGQPFSEDHYGVGRPKGDDGLRAVVNDAVEQAVGNGDLMTAFEHTLGDSEGVKLPEVDRYQSCVQLRVSSPRTVTNSRSSPATR